MLLPTTFVLICELLTAVTAHVLPGTFSRCNPFIRRDNCDNIRCLQNYAPVCGSDGVTYSNTCYLSIANCRRWNKGDLITKVFSGKCSERPRSQNDCGEFRFCIEIYDPVCGSDNNTYSNTCYFSKANCERVKDSPPITQAYKGECRKTTVDCDRIACTKNYAPVCGSDGTTYANECILSIANCRTSDSETPVTQDYAGKCSCPSVCIQIYAPVCGSDGKTYSNSCFLGIASCNSRRTGGPLITEVSKLPC